MDSHGQISCPVISHALKFAIRLQPGSVDFAVDVNHFGF